MNIVPSNLTQNRLYYYILPLIWSQCDIIFLGKCSSQIYNLISRLCFLMLNVFFYFFIIGGFLVDFLIIIVILIFWNLNFDFIVYLFILICFKFFLVLMIWRLTHYFSVFNRIQTENIKICSILLSHIDFLLKLGLEFIR